jgi:hypothetical protein
VGSNDPISFLPRKTHRLLDKHMLACAKGVHSNLCLRIAVTEQHSIDIAREQFSVIGKHLWHMELLRHILGCPARNITDCRDLKQIGQVR